MDEYKKRTNTGDEVIIRLHPVQSPPRPTAVLFGWLASKHRNLSKYSTLYASLGYNTVQQIAPASTVFALHPRAHLRFLLSVLRILAADKRLTGGGIVFHFFSNGGAFCAPHLANLFGGRETVAAVEGEDDVVVEVCRKSFCGLVFDSSPCYLHTLGGARAMNEGLNLVFPFSLIVTMTFWLLCVFQRIFVIDLQRWFWESLTSARYPCPENYIYSTNDHLLDSEKLDALIERRRRDGREIHALRVEDASHVLILRKYPDKYLQVIKSLTDGSVNDWRRSNQLDNWLPEEATS